MHLYTEGNIPVFQVDTRITGKFYFYFMLCIFRFSTIISSIFTIWKNQTNSWNIDGILFVSTFLEGNTHIWCDNLRLWDFLVFHQFCMNLNLTFGKLILDFLFNLFVKLGSEEQNWGYEIALRNSWKHHSVLY